VYCVFFFLSFLGLGDVIYVIKEEVVTKEEVIYIVIYVIKKICLIIE
jgi:hypothetical protein